MIDISKMNKAEVLAGLYNASHPQERGFLQTSSEDMTIEQAQSLFDEGYSYFDYLKGRNIKVDLSKDEFEEWLYDKDNGSGAAQAVIDKIKGK